MKYENIPYRVRRGNAFEVTPVAKRVLHRMGKALREGKTVIFTHSLTTGKPPFRSYDVISIEIREPT